MPRNAIIRTLLLVLKDKVENPRFLIKSTRP